MLGLLTGSATCACCVWPLASSRGRASGYVCDGAALTAAAVPPPTRPAAAGRSKVDLVITRANVVDSLGGELLEDVSILVGDGRILSVEETPGPDAHAGAQRVDARGKFVTPGYNDMHSHVLELDDPSGALALMLSEGVTGFRQMSGSPARLAERRAGTLPIGEAAPALLQMPGTVLTPLSAGSPEAAAAEVRAQKAQGADFIKIGLISPPAFDAVAETARAEAIAVLGHLQEGVDVLSAVRAGFRCIEHLGPGAPVWVACSSQEAELKAEARTAPIKAPPIRIPFLLRLIQGRIQLMLINPAAFAPRGQAERIERAIQTFDEAKFKALAARFRAEETWHCPTLVRLRTQELADAPEYQDHPHLKSMPPDRVKRWRKVTRKFASLPAATRRAYAEAYPHQMRLAKAMAEEGVRMITGTDGGWLAAPGLSLQEEFVELAKAGFSPLQVLQMTTINVAEYLGREDVMGRVAPGYEADLVILDADPRRDVANLAAISGVVRSGAYHSRAALDAFRARVEQGRGYLN